MPIQDIVGLLDQEIQRLQQVRAIIAEVEPAVRRGRPAKEPKAVDAAPKGAQKRTMSPEGRARIAAAQKARWAAQKKSASSKRAAKQ